MNGMSSELDPLVRRYQNSVHDPLTPGLDRRILAAAAKRARAQRYMRGLGSCALVAAALAVLGGTWPGLRPAPPVSRDSGRLEGATREYLLHVQARYPGPELDESYP